jgi:hypothetical protein
MLLNFFRYYRNIEDVEIKTTKSEICVNRALGKTSWFFVGA